MRDEIDTWFSDRGSVYQAFAAILLLCSAPCALAATAPWLWTPVTEAQFFSDLVPEMDLPMRWEYLKGDAPDAIAHELAHYYRAHYARSQSRYTRGFYSHEDEADELATRWLAAIGMDPNAGIDFFSNYLQLFGCANY